MSLLAVNGWDHPARFGLRPRGLPLLTQEGSSSLTRCVLTNGEGFYTLCASKNETQNRVAKKVRADHSYRRPR